jgi:hypothetical protein
MSFNLTFRKKMKLLCLREDIMAVMENFSSKLMELYQAQKKAQSVTPLAAACKKKAWRMQPS